MSGVSVPSHRSKRSSRAKTPVLDKSGQPKGLTTEEVARLNSARPDLMSGTHSHTSTIDNLSSVSDDANMNNLNQPTLLEPPDSSSDESAASFTCSEMEPDMDVDTGTYIMTRLASIDNLHAPQNGRLDSDGGSQRTPFSSEDENGGSKGPESSNGHFALDQLLNWGPSFQNLSPVCQDIALLNDLSGDKKVSKVQLDANINGEEFV
ncbi:Protocadherin Fat 4 [Holothuria leucospilota]|uniref:Protocadherin Fat 4 n=1 Tax=Holothuria leucospilota TaxID=206669 RepID=A0A9Q1H128_HOLLE|nr:Protocadherin Fat 4 [Holothuria leucospilota]